MKHSFGSPGRPPVPVPSASRCLPPANFPAAANLRCLSPAPVRCLSPANLPAAANLRCLSPAPVASSRQPQVPVPSPRQVPVPSEFASSRQPQVPVPQRFPQRFRQTGHPGRGAYAGGARTAVLPARQLLPAGHGSDPKHFGLWTVSARWYTRCESLSASQIHGWTRKSNKKQRF
jgi:hypothetical protein